jgi:enoyl-CoA hydratase
MLTYHSDGAVSTLTMDDGKANVLSVSMFAQIHAALDRAEEEKTAVLLAGREGMFSGGFDLAVFKQGKQPLVEMLTAGARTAERLLTFPAPTVVACTGHAVAMGVFLLLASDVRLGISQGPFKYAVNEVQIGLTLPRFAVELCRHRLTPARFSLATLTAEPHTPEQAMEAGMLDQLVAAEDLLESARARAAALAKLPRQAHLGTKLRVREELLSRLRAAIESDIQEWETLLV